MQIVGVVISWAVAIGIIGIGIGYARQIGDERDALWTASATRKRGARLMAGQGSPRHRFWSSGNRRHHHCTR
jgi:hypothetical protein